MKRGFAPTLCHGRAAALYLRPARATSAANRTLERGYIGPPGTKLQLWLRHRGLVNWPRQTKPLSRWQGASGEERGSRTRYRAGGWTPRPQRRPQGQAGREGQKLKCTRSSASFSASGDDKK